MSAAGAVPGGRGPAAPRAGTVDPLTVAADPLSVRTVGPWLRELLSPVPADEAAALLARLELAVHEVCMNIVDHAGLPTGSPMHLSGSVDARGVEVRLVDRGRPFDPAAVRPPVPGVPQIRGWGLLLVHRLLDSVSYMRAGNENVWVLRVARSSSGEIAE